MYTREDIIVRRDRTMQRMRASTRLIALVIINSFYLLTILILALVFMNKTFGWIFWVAAAIGVIGVLLALMAYIQARKREQFC